MLPPAYRPPARALEPRLAIGTRRGSAYHQTVVITDPRVGERVASVAASLEPRITGLTSDIRDLIRRDIPTLAADPQLTSLLETVSVRLVFSTTASMSCCARRRVTMSRA